MSKFFAFLFGLWGFIKENIVITLGVAFLALIVWVVTGNILFAILTFLILMFLGWWLTSLDNTDPEDAI